jgi:hypothetical protein
LSPDGSPDRNGSPLCDELVRLIGFLVDYPDEVQVWESRERRGIRFEIRVAPEDLGKVIGRQGRTARALRILLEVRGEQDGHHYALEIRES